MHFLYTKKFISPKEFHYIILLIAFRVEKPFDTILYINVEHYHIIKEIPFKDKRFSSTSWELF